MGFFLPTSFEGSVSLFTLYVTLFGMIYFFNTFSDFSTFPLSSETLMIYMLGLLLMSHRALQACSFFFFNFLFSRLNNSIVLSLGLLISSLSLPSYYQASQQIVLLFFLFISSRMYIKSSVIVFIFMILSNFSFVLENL